MQEKITVVPRHPLFKDKFQEMAKDFITDDNHLKERYQFAIENFDGYMEWWDNIQSSKSARFQFWVCFQGKLIGTFNIRLNLPEYNQAGGHISYEVRPSMRNKGFGKKILEKAINHAEIFGINPIVFECDGNNKASEKIIKSLGAKLYKSQITNFFKIERSNNGNQD